MELQDDDTVSKLFKYRYKTQHYLPADSLYTA